jgi:hypothetical protein
MRRGYRFVLLSLGFLLCSGSANAQEGRGLAKPNASPPPAIEPVDATYVPPVDSKTQALEIVSVMRRESFVRVRVKNVSDKNIYSFRMAYYKSGQALLFSFVMADDKTALAPGEIYKYDYPFIYNSAFAREPLTFQAVLFEDGTGDGEPDKVKSLQDLFIASRKELEHVIAVLQTAIASSEVETVASLSTLLNTLSQVPNYSFGLELRGIAGISLPMWRETAMGRIRDIEQNKFKDPALSIREALVKTKDEFRRTLAKYPKVA